MKRRSDSFFGLHFDFHASPPAPAPIGSTLREEDIREICRLIRPDFIQIDCKGHPGWASYPTRCGNAMPEFSGDPLALWRRVTREEDVALYLHYSGVFDQKYVAEHPDQAARRADGTPSDKATWTAGTYADDLLIPQLTELAVDYGVDGVWVDGECWSTEADFRPETLAAFERETGVSLNGRLPARRGDPYFDEYRDFCRELFRRYLRRYVDELHRRCPTFQIASNWAFSDHMPEAVSADVDFLSGDFSPWDSVAFARYAGRAIAAQHRTWDLMAWNFRTDLGPQGGFIPKDPVQILQEAAMVVSLGGGFQNYITQYRDGAPRMDQIRRMLPVAEFLRPRREWCFRGRARRQTAILLSTHDRHLESDSLFSRTGCERTAFLTSLFCDCGHSTEVVSEHHLTGRCADWPVLVVPELNFGLAPETVTELLDYAAGGGSLMLTGENTCRLFAEAGAPFTVGPLRTDPRAFTVNGRDFGSLLNAREILSDGETVVRVSDDPRSPGAALAAVIPFGRGLVAAFGTDVGSAYGEHAQCLHRRAVRAVLDRLYDPLVRLDGAAGLVELTALEKDGRLLIQLVNANGCHAGRAVATEDYIPPVTAVRLSLRADRRPRALVLRPEGTPLDFSWADGRASFTVPAVPIHSVVEVVE